MPRTTKLYTVELQKSAVPHHVAGAAKIRHGRTQAEVMVVATTKAAAVRRLEEAGWYHPQGLNLSTGGNPGNAIFDAGLLDEEGAIVAWAPHTDGEHLVVRIGPGESQPVAVGRWEYIRIVGETRVNDRCFIRNDGALFPPRWSRSPATPSTGLEV